VKVGYHLASAPGYTSTAYLSDEPDIHGRYSGFDKHTDEPVTVYWDEDGQEWTEIPE
jgi:hypothetical protein